MKKLAFAAMALLMVLCAAFALAQEPKMITYDFGDFTIEFEEGMIGSTGEKVDGGVRLALYPGFDENAAYYDNLSLIWQNGYADLREADIDGYAASAKDGLRAQMESAGAVIRSIEVSDAAHVKHDGANGLTYMVKTEFTMDVEGTERTMTTYAKSFVFSDPYLGTYIIAMAADDMEAIAAMQVIVDTIRWN